MCRVRTIDKSLFSLLYSSFRFHFYFTLLDPMQISIAYINLVIRYRYSCLLLHLIDMYTWMLVFVRVEAKHTMDTSTHTYRLWDIDIA